MSLPLAWSPAVPRGERSDPVARRVAVEPVLALQGIGLRFGGLQVLEGVDLAVQPGEIHALIGPNGAGKSSLLNIISGLYRPSAGRVQLGGQRFRRVPTARLARLGVARSFQNLALFPGLDLRANIALGRVAAERAGLFAQWLGLARARREAAEARQLTEALIHPLGIAAFGRECTRRGVPPPTVSLFGAQFLTWRGIPLIPSDKVPVADGKTKFLLLRVGEKRQGVVGLYQPGLPGEQSPGLSVRFMGINRNAIASYLVSLYCSLAVQTHDALALLDEVEIGKFHDYPDTYK